MKIRFWTLAVALGATGFTASSFAQSNAVPAPKIEFTTTSFDFGRVESGKIVTHEYEFANRGNATLEISDVQSSCGCTASTNWSKRLEPGQSGKLPVLFNSGGMAGPVMKNLWVVSNDPENSPVVLQFTATIWKLVDAIPSVASFSFGPDFQTNETRVIHLINNLEEPITLSQPVYTNHAFQAELKSVKEGREWELNVSVVPPLGPGSLAVPITMATSSPKFPVVTVTAYAMVQPAIAVTPPRIKLAALPLTEAEEVTLHIRNMATNALTLAEPTINAEGVKLELHEVQPGRAYEVTASFPVGFKTESGKEVAVRMKSNQLQSPVLAIPLFDPETIFGDVPAAKSAEAEH